MGSWAELDAVYPPGALTPATAFLAALARLAGARSVYAADGRLASFAPRGQIAYDADVLERAERFVREAPEDAFLAAAAALLSRRQRLCLALNLQERAQTRSLTADPAFAARATAALGLTDEDLARPDAPMIREDLSIFPQ